MRPATDAPTYSDADRTGLSATTFLILCIWLGPRLACSLPIVVAIATLWFLACRRWPIVAVFTAGFNYRLTFDIEGQDATNVDLEDYH